MAKLTKTERKKSERSVLISAIGASLIVLLLFHNLDTNLSKYVNEEKPNEEGDVARSLSINLGGGQCLWTPPHDADQSQPLFSTLVAAYPGSGQRTAFMQLEGLTELRASDDHKVNPFSRNRRFAFMKTNYPLHDGTWGFEDEMSQVVLVLRNPRWAMPGYLQLLNEIDYSIGYNQSVDMQHHTYTKRPPVEDWIAWRETRFDVEIKKWGWFLDYWMEGGLLRDIYTNRLTTPEHFERLIDAIMYGEAELLAEQQFLVNVSAYIDGHCLYDIGSCSPVAIASYENIIDPETGPNEIGHFVSVIEGKPGINVIEQEARACVWEELILNDKGNANTIPDRDEDGPLEDQFGFTLDQMYTIQAEIERLRNKYSTGGWVNNTIAQSLVGYLNTYLTVNDEEILQM